MTKGRPSLGLKRFHVKLRESDMEDLKAYYPTYGGPARAIRGLVARHVKLLNEKVGRQVSMAPDEAEADLLPEAPNDRPNQQSAGLNPASGNLSDGHGGPGEPEHPGEQTPSGPDGRRR